VVLLLSLFLKIYNEVQVLFAGRNNRKWWYGLREERMKDIETERSLG
jgi:hypothetical protein